MGRMTRLLRTVLIASGSAACTSIMFTTPQNNSTQLQSGPNPIQVNLAESGIPDNVSYGDLFLDNFDLSTIGGPRQLVPQLARMSYVPTGPHSLSVTAHDTYGIAVDATTAFSVARCPLCYMCPAGSVVDPVDGQCCGNGKCDTLASANFGVWRYDLQECKQPITVGSQTLFSDLDCISPQTVFIKAVSSGGIIAPKAVAVSFLSTQGGALSQIRVPIGWSNGTNSLNVWITQDAGGHPGTALEALPPVVAPSQPAPFSVMSPTHIFSNTHPSLAANTRYWLVIGAAGTDTFAQWNLAENQADSSTPGTGTYLWNTTNANLSGPWTVSNLPQLRPAFEVDVRQ